ncbi:MAG: hypothetical protein HUJ96_07045 [Marinilabiliaceae bacterium]|nr:hypothetical protein [Marinilabiliaceae bacterium]
MKKITVYADFHFLASPQEIGVINKKGHNKAFSSDNATSTEIIIIIESSILQY